MDGRGKQRQRVGGHRRRSRAATRVTVLLFVALALAAVETLGSSVTAPRRTSGPGPLYPPTTHAVARDVDLLAPAIPSDPPDPSNPASGAPGHMLRPGAAAVHQPPTDSGLSALADAHRLVHPTAHGGNPLAFPPDATPLAAAAGTEPASMTPLVVPPGWGSSVHRFVVGSITRSYLMLRPQALSPTPLPVVVVLHGRELTPAAVERLTSMPITTGPAIEVYPAGYGRSWNAGGCCGEAYLAHIDDVTYLTAVVHQVLASQRDASHRVYLVGYSNGGRMAFQLACLAPGLWAGVAAVEAVPVNACPTTTPVPMMIVASSHDPLLTIADGHPLKVMQGVAEPTVQTVVDDWRRLDGCSAPVAAARVGAATVQTWPQCRGAGRVAYALYNGGSHAWPGGVEGATGTPSAEDLLWGWLAHEQVVTAAAA